MRRHLLLLTFTLILSHFSILNLWADAAPDTWIETGNASYTNQFKWYSLPAVTTPSAVVNIQLPNFDASNWGIYVSFGDADFNQIYYNGILKTNETDYKIQGAGISFRISSLTAQNTVILIKKDGNTKYGLRIYNSAVTINAAGTELLYSYADGQYTTASGSETSCAGTLSSTDKIITGSDFYWSGKHSETVQKYDNTWTGVASNVKCCSRDELTFSASTYKISIVTKNTEGTTRKLPKVQINSVFYSVQRVIVGGVSQSFSENQWNYAGNTETTLEYDIDYSSSGSGTYHVSMITDSDGSGGDKDKYLFKSLTITEDVSCTAPNHVDVTPTSEAGNYGWRYTTGETLKLTATPYSSAGTGSPITSGVTYQWKKKTGATTWKDLEDGVDGTDGGTFSGTTSANLVVSGLTASNAGTYKCVASTGSGCDTESNEFWVRVFTFNGNYSGSSFVANPIVWTDEFNGTATVTLNANSVYEFKVYDNDSHTFGLSSPDIYKDEDNFVIYRNDGNNVALHTGNVAGTYTFTVNIYYSNYGDNPYITLTSVRYPKKMVYMACGSTTWCDATPVFFAHSYSRVNTDVKMTKHTCEDVYYAEVPSYNANLIFTRQKAGSESIAWEGDNFYNKSQAITVGSNDLFTCTGWSNNEGTFSGSSYSPTTYTITFAGNGNSSGSMTDVDDIECDGEVTLEENGYIKTGYNFANWKTNVAITANSSAVAADGAVADEATISDITSDITLTAQWTAKQSTITFDKEGGSSGSDGATGTYGSAMPSITAPTRTGYDFGGYWDGDNGTGNQYYNANGTSAATWNKDTESATKLYAKWTVKSYTVTLNTNDGTINAGNVTSYTYGVGATLPTNVTKDGYRFMGWYAASNFSGERVYSIANDATGNKEYWAKWATLYTITNGNPSNGTITVNSTAIEGETVSILATPSSGYAFSSWSIYKTGDASTTISPASVAAATSFTMPAYGVTVTATFEETLCTNTYTIDCGSTADYVVPTSGTRVPSTQSNEAGIYTDYYTGYHGEGYYDFIGATYSEIYYAVHLPAAQYTFEVYTATDKDGQYINVYRRTDGESGDISYGGYYYTKMISQPNSYNNNKAFGVGRTISEQNLAEEDYIIGLYSNGDHAAYDQVVITANSDVFCRASTYDVTITGSPAAGQASATGAGSYEEGETVTINATPNRGYSFNSWSADPSVSFSSSASTASNSFSMPAANVALTASYNTLTSRTVTVNNDGNGSGSADLNPAYVGETVTLTANPNTGYRFVEWTTSDGVSFASSTSASTTFTMLDKNVTVTANFEEIICQSSRTYQVEDIMITTAGAVTDHDTQATPSNVKIITSENQNFDSNTDDYFASISDGAFVYNTQAESAVYMEVDVPSAGNYTLDVYSGKGQEKNVWVNVYTTTSGSGDHISYGGTTYYKQYYTQLNKDYSTYSIKLSDKNDGTGVDNKAYPAGKCIIGIYTGNANCALDKIVLTRVDDSEVFCKHTITVNNTSGASSSAIADKSNALSGETVTVTAYAASDGYRFTGWTATSGTVTFANASSLSTTFVMPDENVTVQANYVVDTKYTVHYEVVGGNGTISAEVKSSGAAVSDGDEIAEGTILTFTATPSSGYSVMGWYTWIDPTETRQGVTRATTFDYNVLTDITIRVKFVPVMIALGDANNIGYVSDEFSGSSGDGSYLSANAVTDPDGRFNHDVLRYSYNMKSEASYYGIGLPHDPGYSTSEASGATGIGFWYRTEADDDHVLMYPKLYNTSTRSWQEVQLYLPATDGKWKYMYVANTGNFDVTVADAFGFYLNGAKEGKTAGKLNTDCKFWLAEVKPLTISDVTVNSNEEKSIPMVVRDLTIYQGGQVTNEDDILITRNIYYYRPAKDDGTSGKLGNKLDQWYTFAVPFTVTDIEVNESSTWYDINAVYYSDNDDNQSGNPDGQGHFYLQYLSATNVSAMGSEFADRWKYITPDHSLYLDADAADWDGSRYGYPMKYSAYIILFDSTDPSEMAGYWTSNPNVRFVGGAQTIDGTAKEWKVESDGEQYYLYANNTLHSFTLTGSAYVLNDAGTNFDLQETPTIRPFECYVQGTDELKAKYESLPMRRPGGGGIVTGMEKTGLEDSVQVIKVIEDGRLIIIRNGRHYNAMGARVK